MTDLSRLIIPRGFRFGAIKAGLKASGRPDFALIVADAPASAAAAFTVEPRHCRAAHRGQAASERHGGKVRVVAINAGNANCAAGQAGLDAARATCDAAARDLRLPAGAGFPSSTGVIGVPLPAEKLIDAMPALAASLGAESDHFLEVAQAILTTDTVEKTAFARIEVAGADGGAARDSHCGARQRLGHDSPQLVPHATMLVYILTDAAIEPAVLDGYLRSAIEVSFNRISVDGDTSTNDTVLLLASGAGGASIGAGNPAFAAALTQVCTSLARQIVADGEGVTHVVELRIEARPAMPTPCASPRPSPTRHWSRLPGPATIPTGAAWPPPSATPARKSIPTASTSGFGELPICRNGGRAPEFDEATAHAYIASPSSPSPSSSTRARAVASSGPPT